jgi:hypothetical protein
LRETEHIWNERQSINTFPKALNLVTAITGLGGSPMILAADSTLNIVLILADNVGGGCAWLPQLHPDNTIKGDYFRVKIAVVV